MISDARAEQFGTLLLERLGRSSLAPASIRERIARWAPQASAVLAPHSVDAAAEALGICSAEGWPVRLVGGAHGEVRDRRPVVVLSSCRFDEITEHEPADLVVGAGAGIPLEQLAGPLAAAEQWLPLDPPDGGGRTLGGVIADNAAGPLRAGHGKPRDAVLGLEVITGDGRRLRFGGRVVKNVAGYDVVRLLTGSSGRLGLLTHAFVRLRGRARADATLEIPVGRGSAAAEAAWELALGIRNLLICDSLEVMGRAGSGEWVVAVRLLGGEAAVADGAARIRGLAPDARAVRDSAHWWAELSREEATSVAERIASAPSAAGALLSDLAQQQEQEGWVRTVAVHVTDGTIRWWSRDPLPSLLVRRPDPVRPTAGVQELTRRLCAVFDPAGILQLPGEAG